MAELGTMTFNQRVPRSSRGWLTKEFCTAKYTVFRCAKAPTNEKLHAVRLFLTPVITGLLGFFTRE